MNDEGEKYPLGDSHVVPLLKTIEDFYFPLYNDNDIDGSPHTEGTPTTAVSSLLNNSDALPNLLNVFTLAIFL